jgi:hypothetical protein
MALFLWVNGLIVTFFFACSNFSFQLLSENNFLYFFLKVFADNKTKMKQF